MPHSHLKGLGGGGAIFGFLIFSNKGGLKVFLLFGGKTRKEEYIRQRVYQCTHNRGFTQCIPRHVTNIEISTFSQNPLNSNYGGSTVYIFCKQTYLTLAQEGKNIIELLLLL